MNINYDTQNCHYKVSIVLISRPSKSFHSYSLEKTPLNGWSRFHRIIFHPWFNSSILKGNPCTEVYLASVTHVIFKQRFVWLPLRVRGRFQLTRFANWRAVFKAVMWKCKQNGESNIASSQIACENGATNRKLCFNWWEWAFSCANSSMSQPTLSQAMLILFRNKKELEYWYKVQNFIMKSLEIIIDYTIFIIRAWLLDLNWKRHVSKETDRKL
jgi:hypothetical protein